MNFHLGSLSRELAEHGLKQDDFRRISAFSTIRLSSIRHQGGLLYRKKGKPFSYKPITSSLISEKTELAALPVYIIIRLWARIQLLLVESRTQPRKKHHIRKLARKIRKFIPLLPQTSEGFIFGLWAHGVALFATNEHEGARKYFESFLAQMQIREELEMAPWKSVATLSRFCDYQLKKAGVVSEPELISNPFSALKTEEEGVKESIEVNGVIFDLSAVDAANLKAKKYSKIKDFELQALISNRNPKTITASVINELSKYPKLVTVATYYKALFSSSLIGGEMLARELYEQSASSLKSGLQLIKVQPLPSNTLLTKPAILERSIPAKPIVYDVAFDLLQTPQIAKKSILGGWF